MALVPSLFTQFYVFICRIQYVVFFFIGKTYPPDGSEHSVIFSASMNMISPHDLSSINKILGLSYFILGGLVESVSCKYLGTKKHPKFLLAPTNIIIQAYDTSS